MYYDGMENGWLGFICVRFMCNNMEHSKANIFSQVCERLIGAKVRAAAWRRYIFPPRPDEIRCGIVSLVCVPCSADCLGLLGPPP